MPALTGDVTTSVGAVATTIADSAVTFAKFQNISTDSLVGRDDAGTGITTAILVTNGLAMSGANGVGIDTSGVTTLRIAANNVTYAKIQQGAGLTVLAVAGSSTADYAELTAGSNNTVLRRTSNTLNWGNTTDSMLQNRAAVSVMGRTANSSGVVADIAASADGQFLQRSGSAIVFAIASGRRLAKQVKTSGTTFTTSADTLLIRVRMIGAGGGGGGCSSGVASGAAGGGGAAGGYLEAWIVVVGSTAYTIAIGAAGAAGANTGGTGGTGGDTTLVVGATTYTAKGGLGGVGMVAGTTVLYSAGGAGVISTNGDVNGTGTPGAWGNRATGLLGGSGGGGASFIGGAGVGLTAAGAGVDGKANTGGGGGGGCVLNNSAAVVGGAGGSGLIIVEEFS
jgi:hypothetical protein